MIRRHRETATRAVGIGSLIAVTLIPLVDVSAQSTSRNRVQATSVTDPTLGPTLETVRWRHIGPAAFGGRIADLAVDPTDKSVIYIGAASGGVFKTVNGGTTWTPVFDGSGGAQSIGALAIAPSDPQIVWAGTGEANNRQSSSWGNGVYRSLDAGRTWTSMGLEDTHHIGRIVIHPKDPNVVYVAALGHLWGPNEARGVYRTRDAGKSWQKVLGIDAETGVVDLLLDPNGRDLIAAAYQRRRRAFGFVGGGTGSGLYRSADGGDSWQRIGEGLPTGVIGRIGLAQARSQPDVVYAIIEHRTAGGVYRSDDRGRSWRRTNPLNPRPMYYSNLRVDPTNPDRVWLLDAYLFKSIDGGKTFSSDSTGDGIHVDHHAMWIDPDDPRHMLLGNDGGLYLTRDGARSWRFIDNLPLAQYYDISVDDRDPYLIYGGTQDNGTWALPSRTHSQGGIFNTDIVSLAFGDGFYTTPDPTNPRYVYANSQNGRAYVVDMETGEQRLIRPAPADTSTYRFTWSTPVLVSPNEPGTYYYAGHRVFRTRDRGHRWEVTSPDLSRRSDWRTAPIMGVVRDSTTLSRDDGVSDFGTVTTITESPKRAGLVFVGTDDGLVHRSTDGGTTWSDITARFRLATPKWVSRALASQHDAGVAYVAFDGHQDDDFAPYLFRSADGGNTWESLTAGIPRGYVINALAEHPDNPRVLLVGTEQGLLVTYDGGRSWKRAGGTLPPVPIDDIVVHPRTRDIVLGTHGRGLIVLDDTRFLTDGDPLVASTVRLAQPGPATMVYALRALPAAGAGRFAGENPPDGVVFSYVIPERAAASGTDSVTVTISGANGEVVRELRGPGRAGIHRLAWDLRHALPYVPVRDDAVWFGPPRGAWVLPGTYNVALRAGGETQRTTLEVRADPRITPSAADLAARHAAGLQAHELLRAWADADRVLRRVEAVLSARTDGDSATTAQLRTVRTLKERFRSGWLSLKSRVLDVHGAIQNASAAPTEGQSRTLESLRAEMKREVEDLNATMREIARGGLDVGVVRPPTE